MLTTKERYKYILRYAKREAYDHGFKFFRWYVGFTKINGKEYKYPVIEFFKEKQGFIFICPVEYVHIAINPYINI